MKGLIKLFNTKDEAISYFVSNDGLTLEESKEHVAKNTFRANDGSERVWVTIISN